MKIAFTSDVYWPRVNGVTVSANIFMNELIQLGHDVHLWTSSYPMTAEQKVLYAADERVTRLKSYTLFFSKEDRLVLPTQKPRFHRELAEFGPELIHAQTEFSTATMAKQFARKARIPVVQSCHTYFEQYAQFYLSFLSEKRAKAFARWLTYKLTHDADAIVTPTEAMKTILERYEIPRPISVVPTGIQESDFHGVDKADARANSKWFELYPQWRGSKILLYVGRVGQEKNVGFLIDVLRRVRRDCPETILVVAGAGPYLGEFQKSIDAAGLTDRVACLGYVERAELKHLYALADVFTFPSKTETQGLVTIEAMMCRTPAVAIGEMGTREVMQGDNGGFMVSSDVEEFSRRTVELLTDEALYRSKSDEAFAYSQNWTARKMAEKLTNLYASVLESFRSNKV